MRKNSLFVVVVGAGGVGKGLGSVKETISAIQELGKRRERVGNDSAPVQGISALSSDTCH